MKNFLRKPMSWLQTGFLVYGGAAVILLAWALAPDLSMRHAYAQAGLLNPVITTNLLVATWTGGTINNGGHPVTVTGGTGSFTASKSDCSSPSFANCNF